MLDFGAITFDLSIEVVGGGLGAMVGFILVFLRNPTVTVGKGLWRVARCAMLRPMSWIQAGWQRCCQQLKDAPLPLQVAAVLFVLNGWGIIALETYPKVSIGWLHTYPMLLMMVWVGVVGYFGGRKVLHRIGIGRKDGK